MSRSIIPICPYCKSLKKSSSAVNTTCWNLFGGAIFILYVGIGLITVKVVSYKFGEDLMKLFGGVELKPHQFKVGFCIRYFKRLYYAC